MVRGAGIVQAASKEMEKNQRLLDAAAEAEDYLLSRLCHVATRKMRYFTPHQILMLLRGIKELDRRPDSALLQALSDTITMRVLKFLLDALKTSCLWLSN